MLASTATVQTIARIVMCSPRTSAASTSVSGVWSSWVCPAFATPPSARPAYQAKKPRNIENAET